MVEPVSEPALPLMGTQWLLVELDRVAPEGDEGESPPYLVLDGEESRVSGSGGCNRLVGSFEVSEDGIRLGPVAATRMACPEAVMGREAAFLRALEATTRYELDGESLALLDRDTVVARFAASVAGVP